MNNDFYTNEHSKFLKNVKKITGHDSVVYNNIVNVFNPEDIKSAIGNNGDFKHPTKITESKSDDFQHNVDSLEKDLLTKYPQLHTLRIIQSGNDVKLDSIIVKKEHRKSGVGSSVLSDIKEFADKHNKRIVLTAGVRDLHWGTTSHSRLDAFYRRNGFTANKGRNKDFSISATHYYDGKSTIHESKNEHPMIDVDGVMKHRHNSLGQPIYHTDEGIRNFHRWFGDSKAVDEHGRPKVYYHGTDVDIDNFDKSKIGFNNRFGPGFYFTDDKKTFDGYSNSDGGNVLPVYLKTKNTNFDDHLSHEQIDAFHSVLQDKKFPNGYDATKDHDLIKDQLKTDTHALSSLFGQSYLYFSKDDWFRGMKALNIDSIHRKIFGGNEVVVHSPDQIKSAIGNDGTFDHPSKITESKIEHPMIDVDGVMKHRINSEGNAIHPTEDGIRNFHRWANGLELTDEHGRPKIFYHGTSKDVDFSSFKIPKNGAWFTDNKESASDYAKMNDSQDMKYDGDKFIHINTTSRVIPVYLKSTNTHTMTSVDTAEINRENYKRAQGQFFDRLRIDNKDMVDHGHGVFTVIGLPSQIKSAIGNDGTFDHPTKITESKIEHQMIDVDGIQRHVNNSLGQPIHHTTQGIINFYRWFDNSNTVDEHGRPKVFYHGTNKDFDSFLTNKEGIHVGTVAQANMRMFGDGQNIIPVYIKTNKQKRVRDNGEAWTNKVKSARSTKHDSIVYLNRYEGIHTTTIDKSINDNIDIDKLSDKHVKKFAPELDDSYIVFDPSQIKSAIGNDGTFDHPTKITESFNDIDNSRYIMQPNFHESNDREKHFNIIAKPTNNAIFFKPDPRKHGETAWYNPDIAELHSDEFGRKAPRLKPSVKNQEERSTLVARPGLIYRGMSNEEFESIKRTGFIRSNQSMNMTGQEGLTYYSTNPEVAQYNAHNFTHVNNMATGQHHAYIVAVKDPGNHVKIAGTGEHEVGISHDIPASDIDHYYQGKAYASYCGEKIIRKNYWDGTEETGFMSSPTTFIHWERIDKQPTITKGNT